MAGLTFDTGALIGLERRSQRMRKVFDTAVHDRAVVTVPTAVITEWWRGPEGSKQRDLILRSLRVEPLDERAAKLAGEAIARVAGATSVDAIVMASAALRGDVVYTSDVDELERLRGFFPGVRVVRT
jgi:predicted nucleic acid-binding protein